MVKPAPVPALPAPPGRLKAISWFCKALKSKEVIGESTLTEPKIVKVVFGPLPVPSLPVSKALTLALSDLIS